MRRYRLLIFLLALFYVSLAGAQIRNGAYGDLYDSETVSDLKGHVRELSSAMLEGRKAGSEGILICCLLPIKVMSSASGWKMEIH